MTVREFVAPEPRSRDILRVRELRVAVGPRGKEPLRVLDAANLSVGRGETLGIVGESGSGKTMLCRALIGTLERHGAWIESGSISFDGQELVGAPESTWRRIRGRTIAYVPQASMAGLNPVLTVKEQLREAVQATAPMSKRQAEERVVALLEQVRLANPKRVLALRASELSGGMRQRVMIAAAVCERPFLLIADEPTTALDVTVQREILDLILRLQQELHMALILVSHDLAVIRDVCASVSVMYAGATIDVGPAETLTTTPRHPYTRALLLSRVDWARIDKAESQDWLHVITGEVPSIRTWPGGCRFHPRCDLADAQCVQGAQPALIALENELTACIHHDRMA